MLDGELYVHGWALQKINAAVTPVRQTPTEDTVKVEYHVFDRIDFELSYDVRFCDVEQRLLSLQSQSSVKYVSPIHVASQAKADVAYSIFVEDGYEGMMYRLGACPYTVPKQERWDYSSEFKWRNPHVKFLSDKDNRTWHLLKRKNWLDDEFLFVSINETAGEKGEAGFQLWLTTKEGRPFKVSSGLTDREVETLLSEPPVGKKVKVKFLVYSSDGIPLNATILAIL